MQIIKNMKLVSFCIPTNGIIEWAIPSILSICEQDADPELFEIVVTDNSEDDKFESEIKKVQNQYRNVVYKKTTAKGFLNQIECFKLASAHFIKFVNHRACLFPGKVQYFLDFVETSYEDKPNIFFLNGALRSKETIKLYSNFDSFIKNLSYYSSWSGGLAFWKDNQENILNKKTNFDALFPHTDILFNRRNDNKYIINNEVFSRK